MPTWSGPAARPLLLSVVLVFALLADWGTGREVPETPLVPAAAQPVVARAIADLAARRGVDPAVISVVQVEAVEWPDGSIGCPVPGMAYPQVITPGWRIVLALAGATVVYHADERGTRVTPCPREDVKRNA